MRATDPGPADPISSPLASLLTLGRLVAGASSPEEIPPALARAVVEGLGVAAAAVFLVLPGGESRLAGACGLPAGFDGLTLDVDLVGSEIGEALRGALGDTYRSAQTAPLASGGRVFGSLVLLDVGVGTLAPDAVEFLEGLVDLAATGLAGAAQYAELAHSYDELRRSRVALEKGEKLRALGQMAAGVAHDLKNILNPLSLQLQILQRLVRKDPAAMESITAMRSVVVRGVETIDRLRGFSQQSPVGGRAAVDLDKLAREAIGIAQAKGRSGVRYDIVDRLSDPPPVPLPASECVTVLVNLLVNAIDAMPGGGTIEVASGATEGGSWVRIADDGPGMSPEVEQRVFEPFFTTKGDEGTGLGLAMVYSFVQRHRGRLTLQTAPGEGAAFTVWFPHGAPDPSGGHR